MSTTPPSSRVTQQATASVATPPVKESTVIIERRKFPRELPKPDVVELNSDSAWQAFQTFMGAEKDGTAPNPGDSAVP